MNCVHSLQGFCDWLGATATTIQGWANHSYPLPPVISVFRYHQYLNYLNFDWHQNQVPNYHHLKSLLYDGESMPMKLYPPVLLRRYKFGPTGLISLI